MNYCSNCGHELNDVMQFCPECGTPANGNANETSEELNLSDYDSWYERDILHAALSPLVKCFDNGKFFLGVATIIIDIIATSFLLSQPLLAYNTYNNDALKGLQAADKTAELVFAIVWLVIAIFSFGYWMKRIVRMKSLFNQDNEFVVIPLGTYLLQWFGEWIAIILTIGGLFAIFISLFDVHTSSLMLTLITSYGWTGGIIAIVASIFIVFIFRLIAEKTRALAAIANNTSRHAETEIQDSEEESTDSNYNLFYLICIVATLFFMFLAMK